MYIFIDFVLILNNEHVVIIVVKFCILSKMIKTYFTNTENSVLRQLLVIML